MRRMFPNEDSRFLLLTLQLCLATPQLQLSSLQSFLGCLYQNKKFNQLKSHNVLENPIFNQLKKLSCNLINAKMRFLIKHMALISFCIFFVCLFLTFYRAIVLELTLRFLT